MGFVYLLHNADTGLHKIGATNRMLRDRVMSVSRTTVGELRLVWVIVSNNAYRLEAHLHKKWVAQHCGGEWFRLSDDAVREIVSTAVVAYHDSAPVDEGCLEEVRRLPESDKRRKYAIQIGHIIQRIRYTGALRKPRKS